MLVLSRVVDAVAVSSGVDQASETQFGEVLGHGGRRHPDVLGKVAHGVFTVKEGPHDVQPRPVGEQFEHLRRGIEVLAARLTNYLRIHADSVSTAGPY